MIKEDIKQSIERYLKVKYAKTIADEVKNIVAKHPELNFTRVSRNNSTKQQTILPSQNIPRPR